MVANRFLQVHLLLLPLPKLDTTISMEMVSRRPNCRSHHGVFLHPHVLVLRFQSGTHSAHQRAVLLRIQPNHLRLSGYLPSDGGWTRSGWLAASGTSRAEQCGQW